MDVLTIGDFSRMTHLSVKALRHYHDIGLLEPAEVDRDSGYRLYQPSQIPAAQVIRRFRDLGMPLEEVKTVIEAGDVESRNAAIVAHLDRMERQLEQTQATVGSLRALLSGKDEEVHVEFRAAPATPSLAVRELVTVAGIEAWWVDAFRRLDRAAADGGWAVAGPRGALYDGNFFELEEGEVVAYLPVSGDGGSLPAGVERFEVPAVELAVALHRGSFEDLDRTYAKLGTFVAERAVAVEGPIREIYLVTFADTPDTDQHRTEVCWPVFRTQSDEERA
jgi:DNA-binding transcriptional MerR regulator/effector-binding domain-containing protein